MSALGQKQTCAAHKVMSALPSKADMCSAHTHVRFVPKAVIEGVNRKTASRRSPPKFILYWSRGERCFSLPAPSKETEHAKAADEERERAWDGRGRNGC